MPNRWSPRLHITLANQDIDLLNNIPPANNDQDNNITEVNNNINIDNNKTNVEKYDIIDISYIQISSIIIQMPQSSKLASRQTVLKNQCIPFKMDRESLKW